MKRKKVFEVEYNYFPEGTYVTPTSERCPLDMGTIYEVVMCTEPLDAGDNAVVRVKLNGEPRKFGVSTEYLREITLQEWLEHVAESPQLAHPLAEHFRYRDDNASECAGCRRSYENKDITVIPDEGPLCINCMVLIVQRLGLERGI